MTYASSRPNKQAPSHVALSDRRNNIVEGNPLCVTVGQRATLTIHASSRTMSDVLKRVSSTSTAFKRRRQRPWRISDSLSNE